MSTNALALNLDFELIDEIIESNNTRAVNKFVRSHQSFVLHTALRYLKDYEDADDITQEVFITALDNLRKFNRKSSIKTWLYKITVNKCKNELRKKKFISFITLGTSSNSEDDNYFDIASDEPKPDNIIEFNEVEKIFVSAYNKLPEKQRETFILRYFDDLSYEEISRISGTSIGGLKANYFQAVQKIANELKVYYGGK
ncbi:MAG TPA: RNA polymerase sigma factor [Candidatus Kapabacteria bacterium]|nr:RNA polymerase sigma factor [Candidatus Kapabacteria bacterium]